MRVCLSQTLHSVLQLYKISITFLQWDENKFHNSREKKEFLRCCINDRHTNKESIKQQHENIGLREGESKLMRGPV